MALPRTIRNFNAFVDGVSYFGIATEAKLPQVKIQTEAHRGSGMDGPVGIDMGTEGMTSEITFAEWNPVLLKKLGRQERFVLRPAQMGEDSAEDVDTIIATVGGLITAPETGDLKPGGSTTLKLIKDALGGWRNLALAVLAIAMRGTLLGLAVGFYKIAAGAVIATRGAAGFLMVFARLGLAAAVSLAGLARVAASAALAGAAGAIRGIGTALLFAGRMALLGAAGMVRFVAAAAAQGLAGAAALIRGIGAALLFVGRAARANPLVLVLTAVIGLAYLVWTQFDKIKAKAEAVFTTITGWTFEDVTAAIKAAFEIDLYDAGARLIRSLWDGIGSVIADMTNWVSAKIDGMVPGWARGMIGGAAEGGEAAPTAPGRALGGPVRAGQVYRWREEGHEMFAPRVDGSVISNRELRALRASRGGGGGVSVRTGDIVIHGAPGQSPADIARAVRRELERLARDRSAALHDGGAYAD